MPKYHIEVRERDVQARIFKYEVTLHDSTREKLYKYQRDHTRVAIGWCSYKFMIKRTARKLLREQRKKDNGGYKPRQYRI